MKTIFISLIGCLTAISVYAQTASTVTINVRGNKNTQIIVDGKTYYVNNYNNATGQNDPVSITDLGTGQHTLQIVRSDDPDNTSNTTYFNVRSGFDLQITITANGSVQQRETRWSSTSNAGRYATPMSDADFNVLYRSANNQWRTSTRLTLISDAFENTNNYFTTAQAKQLISLISSQASRLSLAKASYRTITDPGNFTQLYSLLNSQAHRNELQAYVNTYTNNTSSSTAGMTSTRFNNVYRTAQRQTTASSRLSYISNVFTTTSNYFTVAQARQLIQLVSGESNRLYLAKISYRGIVDRENFSLIHELLTTQASRNELTVYTNTYGGNTSTATNVAMSDANFNTLYSDVQNRWGLGAKMSALTDIFNNETYYFTVAQARQLIQLVSSESNRLQLAKSSYNNIVDNNNFSQLYDVLASQASRNELDTYVKNNYNYQNNSGTTYDRTPMSTTDFNKMYNTVQSTWGFGAKMSALTSIFNKEDNYFTVVQAKQLIQLVSAEDNRLQLAKSAYGNITDPQNFTSMYDVLTSQSSKNELAAYVNSYSYNR